MSFEYKETELAHAISRYVREEGSLSEAELNDPETDLPVYSTVRSRYGGLKDCVDELGLSIDFSGRGNIPDYSRTEIIDWIKEDSEEGMAPKREKFVDSRLSRSPIERLFGNYTNAVFMAGKKPEDGWCKAPEDFTDEISANYIHVTRENYWDGDTKDRWETEAPGQAKYFNPTKEHFPSGSHVLDSVDEDLILPDMRIGSSSGVVDRKTQEKIMKMVADEDVERYLDVVDEIEDTDINEAQVKRLLDPESKTSYGRWMSEDKFPDNTLAMLTDRF